MVMYLRLLEMAHLLKLNMEWEHIIGMMVQN